MSPKRILADETSAQTELRFDQQAGCRPTATTLSAENDNAEPFSLAAPLFENVPRAEIDRIPALTDVLDRSRARRPHANAYRHSDDETKTGAG